MRCASADRPRLVLLVVLLVGLLGGCGRAPDQHPAQPRQSDQQATAAKTLTKLTAAIHNRDQAALEAIIEPGSPASQKPLVDNATALDIEAFTATWMDGRKQKSKDTFLGIVQISYRYGGFDQGETRTSVAIEFDRHSGRLVSIGGHGERSPLWLTTQVRVGGSAAALVVTTATMPASELDRLSRQARVAITRVAKVLPDADKLVVEVPDNAAQLEQVLSGQQGEYASMAAITTTPDGSLVPDAPVHIFLNLDQFRTMDERGALVVLTHEATHVVTRSVFATVDAWLREGFADYVGLAHAGVPVEVAAGRFLDDVRAHGLPQRLPSDGDLSPTASKFGTSYEAAWLVCRSIAEHQGHDRLIAFNRAAERTNHVPAALKRTTGLTPKALFEQWRADVAGLAGVAR